MAQSAYILKLTLCDIFPVKCLGEICFMMRQLSLVFNFMLPAGIPGLLELTIRGIVAWRYMWRWV
jgi:hypothetical protein